MNFSWAMDLDPKGANNQIKEAIDKRYLPEDEGDLRPLVPDTLSVCTNLCACPGLTAATLTQCFKWIVGGDDHRSAKNSADLVNFHPKIFNDLGCGFPAPRIKSWPKIWTLTLSSLCLSVCLFISRSLLSVRGGAWWKSWCRHHDGCRWHPASHGRERRRPLAQMDPCAKHASETILAPPPFQTDCCLSETPSSSPWHHSCFCFWFFCFFIMKLNKKSMVLTPPLSTSCVQQLIRATSQMPQVPLSNWWLPLSTNGIYLRTANGSVLLQEATKRLAKNSTLTQKVSSVSVSLSCHVFWQNKKRQQMTLIFRHRPNYYATMWLKQTCSLVGLDDKLLK